ncbi:MAG TPA: hypothetical protein VN851_04870 [Thermoanaerobaculia bacterium]|nr:hypothetical protein [Thermoanaerobaculia bacterium]
MPSLETAEARPSSFPASRSLGSALGDAERLGRLEAEAFDAGLREIEQRERENLMGKTVLASDQFDGFGPEEGPVATTTEMLRLRREIDRLADFHRTLLHSRSWRLLQALKRPLGRAW